MVIVRTLLVLAALSWIVPSGVSASVTGDEPPTLLDSSAPVFHSNSSGSADSIKRAESAPFLIAKKKTTRYGLEGRVVDYDEGKGLLTVKVVRTKVSGGAGTGRVAGKPAPRSIKTGSDIAFRVVAEGSVLKRTVIKNLQGGGLDTTGTKEGFQKALNMVPKDQNVVFSFEKIDKPPKDGPEYELRIIQMRMTQAEAEARLQKMEAQAEANDTQED